MRKARRGRATLTAAITSMPTRWVGSFGPFLVPLAPIGRRARGRQAGEPLPRTTRDGLRPGPSEGAETGDRHGARDRIRRPRMIGA